MRPTTLLATAALGALAFLGFLQACSTDGARSEMERGADTAKDGARADDRRGAEHARDQGSVAKLAADAHAMPARATSTVHAQEVMKSSYCASCHPDIYAEHTQNTHGRAFTDEEVRLGTGRFSQADCIICHTPRPIFESGIGMNPIRRHHDLEEGNTCMTCHWKEGYDYGLFQGGKECAVAFDPRAGEVEACASCHRNHGTPFQWETAKNGKQSGRTCIDCHMARVERPVAVGEKPREVRSHVFPGARDDAHVRKAYDYTAKLDGNAVVVTLTNKGAGHNIPTELKQRAFESLVIVRDVDGKEVARSRMTFRDPYKRPYGLTLPVNTQIPSGESRTHRVPIGVANGTVECELHFKLYYPIEDNHPDLARRLEARAFPFSNLAPSTETVESEPDVKIVTPDGIAPETAGPANLVDYAHPAIGKVDVDVPKGDSEADIRHLIDLFQFPVPAANVEARKRLVAIGVKAAPALVAGMGSWDNKTWNQSMAVLEQIGEPAGTFVADATMHDELYVRLHAYELLGRMGWKVDRPRVVANMKTALARPNALDRSVACQAVAALHLEELEHDLAGLLADADPDVVRGAARALAHLGVKSAAPAVRTAFERAYWDETRRDLAEALARLGDPSGVPALIAGLDHQDDLIRESFFEALFDVTGRHFGYEALAPREERLASIARWQAFWAKDGGASELRPSPAIPWKVNSEARRLADMIGGTDGSIAQGDDAKTRERLLELGEKAVPALAKLGLKYPSGFADKRAQICSILADIRHPDSVPALIAALRDPVVAVSAWSCYALERIGDRESLPALQRYHQRLLSLASRNAIPASAGTPDVLVAQACKARAKLGDARAVTELVGLVTSNDVEAAKLATDALRERFGAEIDLDPTAPVETRRAWVERFRPER